jgi:hypothetical protein
MARRRVLATSAGPAEDCVVDKIEEFSAELAGSRTSERERRLALQYLLPGVRAEPMPPLIRSVAS